jgi:hypothetical protein
VASLSDPVENATFRVAGFNGGGGYRDSIAIRGFTEKGDIV